MKTTFALVLVLALRVQAASPPPLPATVSSSVAQATPNPNPPSEQSVNEMMNLLQLDGLLGTALKQMNEAMMKNLERDLTKATQGRETVKTAVEDFRKKYDATMKEDLSLVKIKAIYVQAYRDTFTQEEVSAIIAFYKSPAGKAITEKNPTVMQKAAALTEARIAPLTQKLDNMQMEFLKGISAPPK